MAPDVEVVNTDGATQWRLKGFDVQRNNAALNESQRFMDIRYRNFLSEVNNLNRRMGDLRDTQGEAGAWARFMTTSGSGEGDSLIAICICKLVPTKNITLMEAIFLQVS